MKPPYSHVPSLPAALGIIAGILLYNWGHVYWVIGVAMLGATALFLLRRNYVAAILLFMALGLMLTDSHRPNGIPPGLYGQRVYATGKIDSSVQYDNTRYCVIVDSINHVPLSKFKTNMTVPSARIPYANGTRLGFVCTFDSVRRSPDLPHEIDYMGRMSDEDLVSGCKADYDSLKIIRKPAKFDVFLDNLRKTMYNSIVLSPINQETASFLVAALLGDKELLTDTYNNSYRAVGAAHILAISGLHVGIIASLIYMLLIPFSGTIRRQAIRSVVTVVVIWVYALIVGFTPSIVRAAVMLTVFVTARMIQRGANAYNSLLLSVVIILCINPNWLYSPGFQLSVCAVGSLLLCSGLIPQRLKRRPLLYYSLNLISVPTFAMIGTGIVSAYYFSRFPLLFLPANIIVGVLMAPLLSLGLLLACLQLIGLQMGWLGAIVDGLYWLMSTGVGDLANISWGQLKGLYFSAWVILPYAFAVVLGVISIRDRSRVIGIYALVSLVFAMILYQLTKEGIPTAELYIPSTGRYTNIIYQEGGSAYLWTFSSDAASARAMAESKYQGFLDSRGCDSLEVVNDGVSTDILRGDNNIIRFADHNIIIVNSDSIITKPRIHFDYALLTEHFKGHPQELHSMQCADTLLISYAMHPRTRQRIAAECGDSIPYRDLHESPLRIVYW